MMAFVRGRLASFRPAFAGFLHVLRTQPNAWVHGIISLAVVAVAFWLRLGGGDWALLLLTMAIVWVTEFLNTAIEAVVDLASPKKHGLAKIAKDVSAAAVVIAAVFAVIIGLLVLGPPLWARVASLL